MDTPASHPEWSLFAPLIAKIGSDTHILVSGWYGPVCGLGESTPTFANANPTEQCGSGGSRSFTVDATTGLATSVTTAHPHAFGATATLDDGRVFLSGGIASLAWDATTTTDVFTGALDEAGAALRSDVTVDLSRRRFWHSSSPLADSGALIFGGLELSADLMSISFPPPEVIYFSR
jgi:hypothetical protein